MYESFKEHLISPSHFSYSPQIHEPTNSLYNMMWKNNAIETCFIIKDSYATTWINIRKDNLKRLYTVWYHLYNLEVTKLQKQRINWGCQGLSIGGKGITAIKGQHEGCFFGRKCSVSWLYQCHCLGFGIVLYFCEMLSQGELGKRSIGSLWVTSYNRMWISRNVKRYTSSRRKMKLNLHKRKKKHWEKNRLR